MNHTDALLGRLEKVTKTGSGWSARCPAHEDNVASLSINEGADGRALVNCHAGCDIGAVLSVLHLEMTDLFPEREGAPLAIDTYEYRDETGQLLYVVERRPGKEFRQRAADGTWSLAGVRRVLYRLPQLLEALKGDTTVFVVEGERDVHTLEARGLVATTNSGGAKGWRMELGDLLVGAKRVVVIPDNDAPGRAWARNVVDSVTGQVDEVRLLELPDMGAGGDVTDWFAAGGTVDGLRVLYKAAEPPSAAHAAVDPYKVWSTRELLDAPQGFNWLANGLLVEPTYGMIGGEQKSLKSYLAMFITAGVAAGVPILGQFDVAERRPVLTYVGEGGRVPYTRRLKRIAESMGIDLADIPLMTNFGVRPAGSEAFQEAFVEDIERYAGGGLVVIDPYYAFHGATTNAANLHEEGGLLTSLSGPCLAAGASLLIVNHFNKTGGGKGLNRLTMSGGAEWSDTWILVSHRQEPEPDTGDFWLEVNIGSRQWGGSKWEWDMHVGSFDPESSTHDGPIEYELNRASGASSAKGTARDLGAEIQRLLAERPFQMTERNVIDEVGGNRLAARAEFRYLKDNEVIRSEMGKRPSDTKPFPLWGLEAVPAVPSEELF